jgi:quercetin dioxygenase-like cupin family protein
MAFFNVDSLPAEIVEGNVERRVFTTEKMMMVFYTFPPKKTFPPHSHEVHEQMGFLVSGKLKYFMGGEERLLKPGDCYFAPPGVEHYVENLEETTVLMDVFCPPREDFLKKQQ